MITTKYVANVSVNFAWLTVLAMVAVTFYKFVTMF